MARASHLLLARTILVDAGRRLSKSTCLQSSSEIDSITPKREKICNVSYTPCLGLNYNSQTNGEVERGVASQLLTLINTIKPIPVSKLIVIAATNSISPAPLVSPTPRVISRSFALTQNSLTTLILSRYVTYDIAIVILG